MTTTIHNGLNFLFIRKKFNEGESTRISDELSLVGICPSFKGRKVTEGRTTVKEFQ